MIDFGMEDQNAMPLPPPDMLPPEPEPLLDMVEPVPMPEPPKVEKLVVIEPKIARNKEKTVERLVSRFHTYRDCNERQEIERIWRACHSAYIGMKAHATHYVIRECFRQMETLKPQLAKIFFGGDELFNMKPRLEGFDEEAEGAAAVIHDQLRRYGSIQQLQAWVDNWPMYGTAYLCPAWRKYKQTRHKLTPMHAPEIEEWKRETTEVTEEAPCLEFIPCQDVYTHPHIEEAKDSPAAFIIKGVSVSDLKTLCREGYLDSKATQEAVEANEGSFRSPDYYDRLPYGSSWEDNLDDVDGGGTHQLMQCWTIDGYHYVVLDEKHLLHAMPTDDGQIPLITLKNYPQVRQHWGIPEIFTILDDQRVLNEMTGMKIPSVWYALNPMWKVKANTSKAFSATTFKPGGKIVVDNMDDVAPLEVLAGNLAGMEQMEQSIRRNMTLTTGLSNELAGAGSDQRTATGLVRLQDAAGARMQYKVMQGIPAFRAAMQAMYDLNARYANQTYTMRITGSEGADVFKAYTPKVFMPSVDVEIEVGSGDGPEVAVMWQNAYKLCGQDPLVNRQPILDEMFRAQGAKKIKRFRASSMNSQGDAVAENQQFLLTGIIAEPKPGDRHDIHFQIQSMLPSTPEFLALPPEVQARFFSHLAIHQGYVQQMEAANAAAQQAQIAPDGPGAAGPAQAEGNARAEAMFQNGERGAAQAGAGMEAA